MQYNVSKIHIMIALVPLIFTEISSNTRNHHIISMFNHKWIPIAGGTLALLSVLAGAFATHGLQSRLGGYGIDIFKTAAQYQMYHALILLFISLALNLKIACEKWLTASAFLFLFGVLVFSGSLYLLALTNIKWLGAITPIGGTALLLGWIFVVIAFAKK